MNPTSSRFHAIIVAVAIVLGAAGCGKDSKEPDKGKTDDKAGKDTDKDKPAADKPPVRSARKLPSLPLQADVADSWTIEEDKVVPGGGANLSTKTGGVSIMNDGVAGMKKMTLDDEKQLMASDSVEVKEEQLPDGWVLSYKTPGFLPYHATVYRNIGDGSYRCVITTEQAAEMADGIAVCKSLRP